MKSRQPYTKRRTHALVSQCVELNTKDCITRGTTVSNVLCILHAIRGTVLVCHRYAKGTCHKEGAKGQAHDNFGIRVSSCYQGSSLHRELLFSQLFESLATDSSYQTEKAKTRIPKKSREDSPLIKHGTKKKRTPTHGKYVPR